MIAQELEIARPRYKQVVHRLPLKIIAGLTPNSAVDVVWAGLAVLHHERSYGGAFALSRLDSVEPAQVGLQALRRDIDADVAAISRFGEENMRIVRTQGIDALLRPGLRADRGADKLRGDRRRRGIVVVELQLVDVEGVDVAADHHRIALARKGLQQPLARNRVDVPAVGPGAPPGAGELVELRHARLLRDDVPARARRFERGSEPLLLRRAEHGAPRIGELGTLCRIDRVRAAAAR